MWLWRELASSLSADQLRALVRRQADRLALLEHRNRKLEAELLEQRRRSEEWDWVFEHSVDLIVVRNEDGKVVRVSPSVERILGYTPEEYVGFDLDALIHPQDFTETLEHLDEVRQGTDVTNSVTRLRHKNGDWRWLAWAAPAHTGSEARPRPSYVLGRDITASKLNELQLLHRAQHDGLTGLANRASFEPALQAAVERARACGATVALMLLDLDGFKQVNDTYGHQAGDAVLKTVAERLCAAQRKADLIARLGGDEFACLMEGADVNATTAVARRILAAIRQPISYGDVELSVGCSIGIADTAGDRLAAAVLYERADLAMYEVKAAGKFGYRHYQARPPQR